MGIAGISRTFVLMELWISLKEIDMKQLVLDVSAAMVLAGFVTVVTVWMMVIAA